MCFCGYYFRNLWCTKQLKIFLGFLGSSKSTFMPGLPVNGKRGRSAPDFAHVVLHATVVTDILFFMMTLWLQTELHFFFFISIGITQPPWALTLHHRSPTCYPS
jgi:hypothetical protein